MTAATEMSEMAGVCIRCLSKDHTTRDHDEGKVGGVAAKSVAPAVKRAVTPTLGSAKRKVAEYKPLQHQSCWKTTVRRPGIPEMIDKPLRDDWRERKHMDENTPHEHLACSCKTCEQKRKKKELEYLRRTGKVH